MANITLSCIDVISVRDAIADVLASFTLQQNHRDRLVYWMDFGNKQVFRAGTAIHAKGDQAARIQKV